MKTKDSHDPILKNEVKTQNNKEKMKKGKEKSRKRKARQIEETIAGVKDNGNYPGSPRTKFPPIVLFKHRT